MNKKGLTQQHLLIAFAILLGFSIYSYIRIHTLSLELAHVTETLSTVDARLASTTVELATLNTNTAENFKRQSEGLTLVETKVGAYREEASTVLNTVSTLQKLSQTDPQLLAKYSKVFFLNENYAPARLTAIPDDYKYSNTKAVSIQSDVWTHLKMLIDDARRSNINLFVSSGYRSFAEQKNLKSDYRVVYGAGTANQFSADQGYSEHQLGTALDFITSGIGGDLDSFEGTPAQLWLMANAYRYGFILSYPKSNTYYQYEPWHWRYVGIKLAKDLHDSSKNFYDLDQREIDRYLVNIFE